MSQAASSNQIKKDAARGSAAIALLPSKETLGGAYLELRARIDQIVEQAQQERSLKVAISGLNSIRQTLDSLARLAGHLQPASTQVNVAVQTNVNVGAKQIAERLIQKFDHEPELKARIAQALLEVTMKTEHEIAYRLDPALWAKDVLGISPRIWQEQFLRVPLGQDVLVLTARQIGKTTAAAIAIAHTAMFKPGSVSVVACPAQRQSAELLRKVREMVLKGGAKLTSDNVYGIELANGSRGLALPGSEESIRGLTVDGWIVVDEAAYVQDDNMIAALRPMRAQRPEARFVMLSTANSRTDPFWSAWETGGDRGSGFRSRSTSTRRSIPRTISIGNGKNSEKIVTSGNFSGYLRVVR